jgi:peptidoglycan/xylan/chitin deacetylase (PgdA/CDA1 family)
MSPARPRLAVVSIDLDEIPCYTAIHGLEAPSEGAAHAIYRRAIPRYQQLFWEEGIAATFFVIGRDAESPGNASILSGLRSEGHELANHSHSHPYDLSRLDAERIRDEITRGEAAIANAAGRAPTGFRSPGYVTTDRVLALLSELGYRYDSSVFPCPPYYLAKAAAMGLIALRGRRSRSIVDDPRMLTAPADPYRTGTPYWTRGEGLLELPVGVTRNASGRLPYIGTSVVLAGPRGADRLTRLVAGRPLVNLELHGIDLADAAEDGLEFLRPHQPDLRRTVDDKRQALRTALHRLRQRGYEFVTLEQAAEQF